MKRRGSRWAELDRRFGELRRRLARPGVTKALRIIAISVGALFLAHAVIVNAALRLGAVEWFVNSGTDAARLTLGPSYSWIPGRVEVRELTLRFEDRNVQFELSVPRATAKLDFFALAKKQLHLRSLEADGVRFLFRHKVTRVAGNEKRLANFPRIAGFADPPLLKPEPLTDKTKDWAFFLENVRARAVELWFMEYRYTGPADVTGAFELAPGRKLWVGPAHADFVSGRLGIGAKRPLSRALKGVLDFRFEETNPDPIPGLLIFRQVSARLALDGDLVDLEAANLYLSNASRISVTHGAGTYRARVALARGRFEPESTVTLRGSEDVSVSSPDATFRGRLGADLSVRARSGEPTRLVASGSVASGSMNVTDAKGSDRTIVSVRRAEATLVSDNADVASPWKLWEAAFRVHDGRVDDLAALDRPAPKKRVLEGGSAWFFAHAELARGSAWSGALRADARRVRLRLGDRQSVLDGSLSAAAESPSRNLENGTLRDVALQITNASASEAGFDVNVRAPSVTWSEFPPGAAQGRATLRAPSIEPLLEALGAPPMLVSVWPDAPVDASARFAVDKDALDLRLDLAESGPFRAMGRLRVCSPARGAFLVKNGAFSVGLSLHGGRVRVVPLAGTTWLRENAPVCPSVE